MYDYYHLTGPGPGSTMNLGSWLMADPGPDFDANGVMQNITAENSALDGARFVSEYGRARRFTFPLLLASGPAGSLDGVEGMLKRLARPGAYVDLQPAGVPTGEMIRFDVISGEVAPRYSVPLQRHARRLVSLSLDVQPFGYMPTWIKLASVASWGLPGTLRFASAPALGDVPGYGEIIIGHLASGLAAHAGGSWMMDYLAWSLNATSPGFIFQPSAPFPFNGEIVRSNTSLASGIGGASYIPRPGSNGALAMHINGGASGWQYFPFFEHSTPSQLFPPGAYRIYAYAKLVSSGAASVGIPITIDRAEYSSAQTGAPALASGAAVATLPGSLATPVLLSQASPQFGIVDLGIVRYPSQPTGMGDIYHTTRIWLNSPAVGNPTTLVTFGGYFALRTDGPHGVITQALSAPLRSYSPADQKFWFEGRGRTVRRLYLTASVLEQAYAGDLRGAYRGQFPMIGASIAALDIITGARAASNFDVATANPTYLPNHTANYRAFVSVRYQPRFSFLKGI
jgi:hypothetical protein